MNGLDLFSGIGGITVALSEWVRPIAYCESDRFAQAILLSRMSEGKLPRAPIWSDVSTITPQVLHRIKALGNAVVPLQAKEAFKRLCGLK